MALAPHSYKVNDDYSQLAAESNDDEAGNRFKRELLSK